MRNDLDKELNSLGWFTWDELLMASENIYGGVYSMVYDYQKPAEDIRPEHLDTVFYIGFSGGPKGFDSMIYDQKNKEKKTGKIYTTFRKRMIGHRVQLNRGLEGKFHAFFDHFKVTESDRRNIYIHVYEPKNEVEYFRVRGYLMMLELKLIHEYMRNFGRLPVSNIDQEVRCRRKEGSISHKYMNNLIERNLENFI